MKIILPIILSFTTLVALGQPAETDRQFSIYFTSCFKNDLITLKLNGLTVIEKRKLTSGLPNGLTDLRLYQDSNQLAIGSNRLAKIILKDTLVVDVLFNGKPKHFEIDLREGKYILFNNCYLMEVNNHKDKFHYRQLKTPPTLD